MGRILAAAMVLVLVLAPGRAGADVPHPAPIPSRTRVPMGSAVWYACTDPSYSGPSALACVVPGPFDPRYAQTFTANFDQLTPENELKMLWTQPTSSTFDFSVTDKLVAFAQAHGKAIRGHNLIYGGSDPGWVDHPQAPWTRDSLLDVMRTRIATVVGRYKDAIREWDVVNEPFTDSGTRDQSVWQRVIGDDWVEQAFRAANAADPSALLFLNEFAADVVGPRQQAVLSLVSDFVHRGVPIDGVGLEMHVGVDGNYPTAAQIEQVMAQYAALGLRVEVTEADALTPPSAAGANAAAARQRQAFDDIATACRVSVNCTSMTVWGVADPYSWRGAGQKADLFDASFAAKPSLADVRCRLNDPRPAGGSWTPADCDGDGMPDDPGPAGPLPPTGSSGSGGASGGGTTTGGGASGGGGSSGGGTTTGSGGSAGGGGTTGPTGGAGSSGGAAPTGAPGATGGAATGNGGAAPPSPGGGSAATAGGAPVTPAQAPPALAPPSLTAPSPSVPFRQAATPRLRLPARVSLPGLKRGVPAAVSGARASSPLVLTLRRGRVTLLRLSRHTDAHGARTLALRVAASARRRLRRGTRLSLAVTVRRPDGTRSVLTATLRVA